MRGGETPRFTVQVTPYHGEEALSALKLGVLQKTPEMLSEGGRLGSWAGGGAPSFHQWEMGGSQGDPNSQGRINAPPHTP